MKTRIITTLLLGLFAITMLAEEKKWISDEMKFMHTEVHEAYNHTYWHHTMKAMCL